MKLDRPLMLMILDGFGYREEEEGNAVLAANTPNWDKIKEKYPWTLIKSSGNAVGLPEGQMGNSEVGHLNIGAGRIVYQDITRIDLAIKEKEFFENKELLNAFEYAKKNNGKVHLMGLVSDGGVHSSDNHYFALIDLAKRLDFHNLFVHAFMDGRDTPPTSGVKHIENLHNKLKENGVGRIATVSGRFYAMDRDKRWARVEKAYNAIAQAQSEEKFDCPVKAVEKSYEDGKTDEFIIPRVILNEKMPYNGVEDGDAVIFFNFRADRARELSHVFLDEEFNSFDRVKKFDLYYVTMTDYDKTLENVHIAFPANQMTNILGDILAQNGLKQLRIAETEKYAHVTFFFNGGVEVPFENEERILIPSPKVETYDLQPEMSAPEVTEKVIEQIKNNAFDVIILNFANSDMVGHTGIFDAAVKAVEEVDRDLGKIFEIMKEKNGILLVTADHGNSEMMIDPITKEPFTAHTTTDVPFVVIDMQNENLKLCEGGKLADIAPTMLDLLNIEQPKEMTGISLINK